MGNRMVTFSTALGHTLRAFAQDDVLAAKAARANKVRQMYCAVIEICCRPNAQAFLEHTNSVYIIQDQGRRILIVYVDDSIFAAELNARREMIKLKILEHFDEEIDEFRILISRGAYKDNHPFKKPEIDRYSSKLPRTSLSQEKCAAIEERAQSIKDTRVRKALVKAMISGLECKYEEKDQKS